MNVNLYSTINREMLKYKSSIIKDEYRTLNYMEFLSAAEALKKELCSILAKGNKCAIMCTSELNAGICIFACMSGGITAIPLPARYDEKYCNKIINECTPDFILTDYDISNIIINNSSGIYHIEEGIKRNSLNKIMEDELNNVAFIMYTSGTTGNPKGSMLTHYNIFKNLNDINEYFGIDHNDIIFIIRPLYHAAVLTGEFLISLYKGLDVVFCSKKFNNFYVLKAAAENKITVLCATPTIFYYMTKYINKLELNTLKKIVISGECMTDMIADEIISRLPDIIKYNVYGLTEASPRITYLTPELFNKYKTSVGIPLKSVQIKIINDRGLEADFDECGELIIKGPNVMKGYYKDTQTTKERIKKGWLYTGDIAFKDKNGLLTIKGRKDDLIIKSGMNIYPQEIENALKTHDLIKDALVLGIDENETGQKKIVLIVIPENKELNKRGIFKICTENLPQFQLPDSIEIVDQIKKGPSGKSLRKIIEYQG